MPSRPFPPTPNPKSKILFLVITISASAFLLFAILYFIFYLWYFLLPRSRTNPIDSTATLKLHRFSYCELASATNGFSDSNLIGKGGSGTVYFGILRDGKSVAIKRLESTDLQAEREFQNELQILGSVKSPFVVTLLGFCVGKSKRLLVYEYMPNRSLQELLFSGGNSNSGSDLILNWERRFEIIFDVARALAFLHTECDPPVIHGDVKPSNVLLDSEYRARISDFGLSRVKVEGEFGMELFSEDLGRSQELWKSQELSGSLAAGIETPAIGTPAIGTPVESPNEVDFALALQASSSSKNSKSFHNLRSLNISSLDFDSKYNSLEKGKEVSTMDNDDGFCSVDHSKELNSRVSAVADDAIEVKQWGRDWWWKQSGSGELCSKDYVMEWIGSQICPSENPNWDEEKKCSPEMTQFDKSSQIEKLEETVEPSFPELESKNPKKRLFGNIFGKKPRKKKQKKMQEWWKEEHLAELGKKRGTLKKLQAKFKKGFKIRHCDMGRHFHFRRKFRESDGNERSGEGEFSFRRGWKKKKSHFSGGSEMWSGDLFSRELSSTTSMRGTLCYVAPELGGCGYLMEKADIYSLGVLILVIISGRRPLDVLSSPMKLERANLVSWCRHLAQVGNVLELVDERLKDRYDKEKASLCINLAIGCLQKMPELRPDIGDIVKILKGEMGIPPVPFEFSPSPPSKALGRSRRKPKPSLD